MNHERHLGGYLRAISNALAQDLQQKSEQLGLTSCQGMFLHCLWVRQELLNEVTYAKDLEEFFHIKHPTVSGILQRMESAEFIELRASEADRRCKIVHLTNKAMQAHAQIEAHITASEQKLTQGMSDEEQRLLRGLLKQAATNLGICDPPHLKKKEASSL